MTNQVYVLDRNLMHELHFQASETQKFVYYSLDISPMQSDWNVVGVNLNSHGTPTITIRLLHFDEDDLAIDTFNAEEDSDTYIDFTFGEYKSLISLFENLMHYDEPLDQSEVFKYFYPLSRDELLTFGVHPQYVDRVLDKYYWYISRTQANTQAQKSIISFPEWRGTSRSILSFLTFPKQEILKADFSLGSGFIGGPTLTFEIKAMQEFIALLKKHSPK